MANPITKWIASFMEDPQVDLSYQLGALKLPRRNANTASSSTPSAWPRVAGPTRRRSAYRPTAPTPGDRNSLRQNRASRSPLMLMAPSREQIPLTRLSHSIRRLKCCNDEATRYGAQALGRETLVRPPARPTDRPRDPTLRSRCFFYAAKAWRRLLSSTRTSSGAALVHAPVRFASGGSSFL